MLKHHLVEAWQFSEHVEREYAERVAFDRLADPDIHAVLLSAGQDWVRAQVVSGLPQVGALLYVGRLGLFEITRRDEWASIAGQRARVLIMLRAVGSPADAAPSP